MAITGNTPYVTRQLLGPRENHAKPPEVRCERPVAAGQLEQPLNNGFPHHLRSNFAVPAVLITVPG